MKIIKIETHVISDQLEQSFFFSQWVYNERRRWPMPLGLSLIISNIWAVRTVGWEDAKKPFQLMLVGLSIIILGSSLLGYSNKLS